MVFADPTLYGCENTRGQNHSMPQLFLIPSYFQANTWFISSCGYAKGYSSNALDNRMIMKVLPVFVWFCVGGCVFCSWWHVSSRKGCCWEVCVQSDIECPCQRGSWSVVHHSKRTFLFITFKICFWWAPHF